ncbi:glycoside hydrolase family 6 protein [Actinospica robiniae]|uniref:glycoside hydrolase family 6 protein n=1 Tax=Actinospica robiniae TaxID=304901 RepID=UPI0003FCAD5B|nr:glycoside hydrolase family 6 protein [Actinospica robiniae]
MPFRTHHRARTRRPALLAALALTATGLCAVPGSAQASAADHTLSTHARLFVPPPTSAAVSQIIQLAKTGDVADAALLTKMEATPQAVWFTSGTPDQVRQQVRQTMAEATLESAVPVLVAYDIPGRDCAQYSAGGALDPASYEAWISAFAAGVGNGHAVVILEPDALGNLPSNCGGFGSSSYPFTDADRYAEIDYAVSALEAKPNTSVYLDGTHSGWQSVGTMTQRLLLGDVQQAQGFYLNVSNYQPDNELTDYGQWISDCIAIVTDPSHWAYNNPGDCASQYYPATQGDFSTWDLTTQWYAANMDGAVSSTHFVIDTSRNGNGPNAMSEYAAAPYNQSASVISSLSSGSWCNPPNSALGLRPTTQTGVPLLDAYLWVKTPGQSDGQCDAAGGARAWDYSAYTQAGWPTDAAGQSQFDPLWGLTDPAAGAWFPQQALQLAQEANPPLLRH